MKPLDWLYRRVNEAQDEMLRILSKVGDNDEAGEWLRNLIRLEKESGDDINSSFVSKQPDVWAIERKGKYKQIADLLHVSDHWPGEKRIWLWDAGELCRRVIFAEPVAAQDRQFVWEQANIALSGNAWDTARGYYQSILKSSDGLDVLFGAEIYFRLAWCLEQLKDYEAAEHFYHLCLEHDPSFNPSNVRHNLNQVMHKQGKYDEAREQFCQSETLKRQEPEFLSGRCWSKLSFDIESQLEAAIETQIKQGQRVFDRRLQLLARQHTIRVGRLDLFAEDQDKNELVVIELKRAVLEAPMVEQISKYLRELRQKNKNVVGILCGYRAGQYCLEDARKIEGLEVWEYRLAGGLRLSRVDVVKDKT